ncbi:MAG TPA: tellurite resistance/C4-dicarboxylate transporter family protein [Candidatus Saccharimonadales bacterium]|nr:tellurite resistance/C4-dicarboxylate transporter family protein [Candidatus Saccharimonadales bacterium]
MTEPSRAQSPGSGLQYLYPGYFALVMATGIISTGFSVTGFAPVSSALLLAALVAYVVLVVLYVMRLVRYPAAFLGDTADASRAFGFFTFVAASNVLALRLALGGQTALFAALATLAALAWAVCSYALVPRVLMRPVKGTVRQEVTGAWLIWVVATQSLALAAARGSGLWPGGRGFLELSAVSLWAAGSCLYLLLMGILLARLVLVPTERQDLSPTYWINMGATAISVFAGASLLGLHGGPALVDLVGPTVAGVSVMFWAFGTWWFPLLVVLTIWRAGGRAGLRSYDPNLWSVVFPLGMYSVASMALGRALHTAALTMVGTYESWVALAAWTLTLGLMFRSWVYRE